MDNKEGDPYRWGPRPAFTDLAVTSKVENLIPYDAVPLWQLEHLRQACNGSSPQSVVNQMARLGGMNGLVVKEADIGLLSTIRDFIFRARRNGEKVIGGSYNYTYNDAELVASHIALSVQNGVGAGEWVKVLRAVHHFSYYKAHGLFPQTFSAAIGKEKDFFVGLGGFFSDLQFFLKGQMEYGASRDLHRIQKSLAYSKMTQDRLQQEGYDPSGKTSTRTQAHTEMMLRFFSAEYLADTTVDKQDPCRSVVLDIVHAYIINRCSTKPDDIINFCRHFPRTLRAQLVYEFRRGGFLPVDSELYLQNVYSDLSISDELTCHNEGLFHNLHTLESQGIITDAKYYYHRLGLPEKLWTTRDLPSEHRPFITPEDTVVYNTGGFNPIQIGHIGTAWAGISAIETMTGARVVGVLSLNRFDPFRTEDKKLKSYSLRRRIAERSTIGLLGHLFIEDFNWDQLQEKYRAQGRDLPHRPDRKISECFPQLFEDTFGFRPKNPWVMRGFEKRFQMPDDTLHHTYPHLWSLRASDFQTYEFGPLFELVRKTLEDATPGSACLFLPCYDISATSVREGIRRLLSARTPEEHQLALDELRKITHPLGLECILNDDIDQNPLRSN